MRDSLSEQLNRIEDKMNVVLEYLSDIKRQETIMSAELDTLTAQVAATATIEQSAIVMIQGLADQIATLKTDPQALQALADALKAKSDELAAAVTANVPHPLATRKP